MNFSNILQAATNYVWGGLRGYVTDQDAGYPYCRSGSGKREELERELLIYTKKELDKKSEVVVLPSGMTAICCIIEIVLRRWEKNKSKKDRPHLVFGDELYCDTKNVLNYFHDIYSFTFEFINVRNKKGFEDIALNKGNKVALLFLESCTNPSGQFCDFDDILPSFKKKAPNCIVCIDNTWTSFCLFNPFEHHADVVVESLTKYGSGGTCIGGMIVGRGNLIKSIRRWSQIYGQFMTPYHCQLLIDGIKTIEERIKKGSELTIKIADWLEKIEYTSRVLYPLLESHPTYKTNLKYLKDKIGPSVILFHLKVEPNGNPKEKIRELLEGIHGIKLETSYGSEYSKVCLWAKYGLNDIYESSFKYPKNGIWIRLAVGYKDNFESLKDSLMALVSKSLTLDVKI